MEDISNRYMVEMNAEDTLKFKESVCRLIDIWVNLCPEDSFEMALQYLVDSCVTKNKPLPVHKKAIAKLDLGARSYNCLRGARIEYIGELIQLTDHQLRIIPGLGNKSYREVNTALAAKGLKLNIRIKNWVRPD